MGKPEAAPSRPRGRAWAWLELLRAPNLLTVPGDPVAGFLLAAGATASPDRRLLVAVAASLCFYMAGLVLNDVADLVEDRAQRPRRPLPSGRISVAAARAAGFLLMAAGLGLCTWLGTRGMVAGAALCVVILAYDLGGKRSVLLGPLLMGLCRTLSMLLGAALVGAGTRAFLVAAGLLNAYIVLVTYLARTEMQRVRRGLASWLPAPSGSCWPDCWGCNRPSRWGRGRGRGACCSGWCSWSACPCTGGSVGGFMPVSVQSSEFRVQSSAFRGRDEEGE